MDSTQDRDGRPRNRPTDPLRTPADRFSVDWEKYYQNIKKYEARERLKSGK